MINDFSEERKKLLEKLKKHPFEFKKVKSIFKNDKEIALTAISTWPGAFQYVSNRLKKDKGMILRSITGTDPRIIRFASNELRNDPEVILKAVRCGVRHNDLCK